MRALFLWLILGLSSSVSDAVTLQQRDGFVTTTGVSWMAAFSRGTANLGPLANYDLMSAYLGAAERDDLDPVPEDDSVDQDVSLAFTDIPYSS